MKIKKIKIMDFGPIKDLELALGDSISIRGESMSGKTTFINAIEICLTGKLNGKAVTKKTFGDKAYVSLTLEDDKIISWSGDEPKAVYVNGVQKSQEQLEKDILNCTFDQFLFEFYPEKFWELSPKEKRKIFSDKFIENKKDFRTKLWEKEFPEVKPPENIEDLSSSYKHYNSQLKELNEEYIGINAVQEDIDRDIECKVEELDNISCLAIPDFNEEEYLKHLQSKPNAQVSEKEQLKIQLLSLEREGLNLTPPKRDETYKNEAESLLKEAEEIKLKGKKIKEKIFESKTHCEYCTQSISKNLIEKSKEIFKRINNKEYEKLKSELQLIMPKYKEALAKEEKVFSEYKKSLLEYQKEADSIRLKKRDLNEIIHATPNNVSNNKLETWQKRTDELNILKNKFHEANLLNTKADNLRSQIKELKEKKMKQIEKITSENYSVKINELEKITTFLSPKGVEKKEMEFIQDKIEKSLPTGYEVSLFRETGKGDVTLEFEIKSKDGYTNFSTGEKLFISHAISSMISNSGIMAIDNSQNCSIDLLPTNCQVFTLETIKDLPLTIS